MADSLWNTLLQVLARREPKTPMAFYSRLLLITGAGIVGLAFADGIDGGLRFVGVTLMVLLLIGNLVWVAILNWNRPELLLYGADRHFEKWKLVYGTEQGAAVNEDLRRTSENPRNGGT